MGSPRAILTRNQISLLEQSSVQIHEQHVASSLTDVGCRNHDMLEAC